MADIKKCPFCGCKLETYVEEREVRYTGGDYRLVSIGVMFRHPYNDCILDRFEFTEWQVEKWNRRHKDEMQL